MCTVEIPITDCALWAEDLVCGFSSPRPSLYPSTLPSSPAQGGDIIWTHGAIVNPLGKGGSGVGGGSPLRVLIAGVGLGSLAGVWVTRNACSKCGLLVTP